MPADDLGPGRFDGPFDGLLDGPFDGRPGSQLDGYDGDGRQADGHVDPETLSLLALGEPALGEAGRAHLAACRACGDEADALREVVEAGRGTRLAAPHGAGAGPSPGVWSALVTELGLAPGLLPPGQRGPRAGDGPAVLAPTVVPGVLPGAVSAAPRSRATPPADDPSGPAAPATSGTTAPPGTLVGPSRSRRHRADGRPRPPARPATGPGAPGGPARPGGGRPGGRTRAVLSLALTAVAAAALAASVTAAWLSRPGPSSPEVLAAPLAPVGAGSAGAGEAVVRAGGDAGATLDLDVQGLPATGGFRQVWLIDLDTGRMVPLGTLGGAEGTEGGSYAVPASLDLSRYDVVDISEEPDDGDPAHSGVSLLRGTLQA